MKEVKIKDVEEFIESVEIGIEQIDVAIKELSRLNKIRGGKLILPLKFLQREKQLGEEELKKFREKELSEVVGGINLDRLTGYRDIIISEE